MLTVKQVAERLRISANLVYSWCEGELLPHYRLGGKGRRGAIRISEADLELFLQGQKREMKREALKPPVPRPKVKLANLNLKLS